MQRHRAVLTFWVITTSRGDDHRARRVCESSRTRSAKTHGETTATASEGSLRPSIQSFAAGSSTSSTAPDFCSGGWMHGYEDAFAAFFDTEWDSVAAAAAVIITDGAMPTSGSGVSTPWPRLISCSAGLVETTDWRAGGGKSARPVRREGEANRLSLPLYGSYAGYADRYTFVAPPALRRAQLHRQRHLELRDRLVAELLRNA